MFLIKYNAYNKAVFKAEINESVITCQATTV